MATYKAAIKATLTGDATLMALLTGGIYLRDDLGRLGLHPDNTANAAAYDTLTGKLKPCAVLVFSTANEREIANYTKRRFFSIYFYDDGDYLTIEQAKRRVEVLLSPQGGTVHSATDAGLAATHWANDGAEFTADELGGAMGMFSRYYVDLTRRYGY